MILKCAIVDDEPLAQGLLESYVKKTPSLQWTATYGSAIDAMQGLRSVPVDLLFLDIQMPELNGLEFAKMVSPDTRIIFTTAFDQYAIDGYKVEALDYLLKPIVYTDFLAAVNKAVKWFDMKRKDALPEENPIVVQGNRKDCIFVKSDYKLVRIELHDILYIEGLKDYIKIHTESRDRPILSQASMKSIEEKLPDTEFIRVHRSYIVQKNKIKIIDRGRIVFGKEYIPVSDSYKADLTVFLNSHTL